MGNDKSNIVKHMQENDALARKIADLIRSELSDEELYSLIRGDGMWLVMQMICSPRGAANCISQSSVNCVFNRL
ncbi:Uncharacterised protein [Serratia marcescens]|nr:Uncharacterised protein [Serratia marcescens]CUZ13297.1 Uncharacterised protein [Serratia marcescens]CVB76489.1 Uncharacterised protein [Serratia marcescens]CVC58525.1 Uncharacterised protein [Serratia marcescens]CVD06221.1 Uncharacterised protein [Serratia marcescens]